MTDRERADQRLLDSSQAAHLTRRRLLAAVAGLTAPVLGAAWIQRQPRSGGVPDPLRRSLDTSARIVEGAVGHDATVPTFSNDDVRPLRVNGLVGLAPPINLNTWSLRIQTDDRVAVLRLPDIRRMAAIDLVAEHKCVEGWSTIVAWTGVPAVRLLAGWSPLPRFVRLNTPDGAYSAAMQTSLLLHPQTLFATGLNGRVLDSDHGAPLRLVVPAAYGYKSIKRIGSVRFSDDRPSDYWYERGYDWYATH